jgi:hypothetical protein
MYEKKMKKCFSFKGDEEVQVFRHTKGGKYFSKI